MRHLNGLGVGVTTMVLALSTVCAAARGQSQTFGAQRPAQPVRDNSHPELKGTAGLRGRVVAADTGRPLRRARVTIVASDLGSDSRKTTSTTLEGTYEFKDLPAARYRVSVTRGGYLPLDYGQRRPGELGRPVQLVEGQVLDKLDFALPRMGVITGRVSDERGEAIEGVTVVPMRSMYFEGRRTLVPVGSGPVVTDDQGDYRLLRLPPGTYYVMATTKETWTVVENGVETLLGYVPTYFPGVPTPGDARRVAVGVGQEVPGTDLSLIPGRAAKVSGHATDSQGRPFAHVDLREEIRGQGFASFRSGPGAPVAADGSFTIADVPPGDYNLTAARLGGDPLGAPEVAEMPITVDGVDIDNLILSGSGGGTVSGQVVAEAGTPKMSGVRLIIGPALRNQPSPVVLGAFRNGGGSAVKDDGTFSVAHVFGRSRFQVTVPEGWMLKTITESGRDLTDSVFELKSGEEIKGVQVVLTNRITTVSGQLIDDKNAPLADATVLVFASNADKWFETSRSVKAARPDQQGQWQIKGLPPGDYLAVAREYIEDGAWNDPEFLEGLRGGAEHVTLEEGGSQTVTVKVPNIKG